MTSSVPGARAYGAVGSILSTLVYAQFGWPGVCMLGAVASAIAIAFWAGTKRDDR